MQLGSSVAVAVAVAVAGSCSANSTPSLAWELPYVAGADLKRQKKKKKGNPGFMVIAVDHFHFIDE